MTQPVHVSESDSELEKELAEIMESAWDEPKEVDNKKPLSFNSFELPNLSELELHGESITLFNYIFVTSLCGRIS